MTKLLENKQIIHIATEIVVLIGITFYFSSKNKKLYGHIEDLYQRLEEQEDLIQKHEQMITKLMHLINSIREDVKSQPVNFSAQKTKNGKKSSNKIQNSKYLRQNIEQSNNLISKPTVSFKDEENNDTEELTSENESDLDAEIADELKELDQDIEDEEGDLKKSIQINKELNHGND